MPVLTLRQASTLQPDSIRSEPQDDRATQTIARAMGCYLNGFAWDHVAHLTYRNSPNVERIKRDVEDRWLRRLARQAQRRLGWFYVAERGGSGLYHVHALVWGTARLTICQLELAAPAIATYLRCLVPDLQYKLRFKSDLIPRFERDLTKEKQR